MSGKLKHSNKWTERYIDTDRVFQWLFTCSGTLLPVHRSRATDPVQVMDEAKDSVPSLQLSKHEILTGYVTILLHV